MMTNATMLSLFYLFLFAVTPNIISAMQPHNYSLSKIRNQYLRLYLVYKKDCIKHYLLSSNDVLKERVNNIVQLMTSKYYNLSPEDIELIDQIINLHF